MSKLSSFIRGGSRCVGPMASVVLLASVCGAISANGMFSGAEPTITQIVLDAAAARDYQEIRNLVNQYYDAEWRMDADGLADTFAPDGELIESGRKFAPDGSTDGTLTPGARQSFTGAKLRKFLELGLAAAHPLPFGHNHVIELLSASRARGRVMNEQLKGRTFTLNSIVYFRDEYVKVGGRWKILRRDGQVLPPGNHPE
jgi:hypothetical protein